MDSREFFRRVRAMAQTIPDLFVVVVSKATTDGGKAGVMSYVSREIAARLIVKDQAELATGEQALAFFAEDKRIREEYEAEQWRRQLQVAVVKEGDIPRFNATLMTPPGKKDQ